MSGDKGSVFGDRSDAEGSVRDRSDVGPSSIVQGSV
jgi:hypothetical protein